MFPPPDMAGIEGGGRAATAAVGWEVVAGRVGEERTESNGRGGGGRGVWGFTNLPAQIICSDQINK